MKLLKTETSASHCAYTIVEVMVSIFVVAIMMISRENLRATQIMVQKMETIRLLNWSQILNTNTYVQSAFTEYYNPAGTNDNTYGVFYAGRVTTNAANVPAAYQNNMRAIIVTVFWTNYPTK